MKNILYSGYVIAAAVFAAILCSCDRENTPDRDESGNLGSLSISVNDAGFVSDGTTCGEYSRIFKAGDRIGVFAVRNGALVEGQSNMCYEAMDNGNGGIIWSAAGDDYGTFFSDAGYFAYFPYDGNFAFTVDPSSEEAPDFFAEAITSVLPSSDQGTEETFRAADFMVGTARISERNTLRFEMDHVMSMVVIELPSEYYTFDNVAPAVPDYVLRTFSDASFDGFVPFRQDNYTFLYVIMPGEDVELSGSYRIPVQGAEKNWSETVGTEAGNCVHVRIEGGRCPIQHTLSPGDFFLADGRLLSKDAPADEVAAADVIGIVFQMDPQRIDPAIADCLGGVSHALVVSSKSVKDYPGHGGLYHWGPARDETLVGFEDTYGGYDVEANFRLTDRDIYGFSYREQLRLMRPDYAEGVYPVFSAVELFAGISGGPLDSAPANTGWYLPAVGEWFDIIRNLSGLPLDIEGVEAATDGPGQFFWSGCGEVISLMNMSLAKIAPEHKDDFFVGGGLWTSSISGTDAARVVSFNNEGYVHCRWTWRDLGLYARAVLAF